MKDSAATTTQQVHEKKATTTQQVHEKRKNSEFERFDSSRKCGKLCDIISIYRPEENANSSEQIGNSCSLDLNSFASSIDWNSNASLDVNAQEVASSANQDSCIDPLRKWKEMKENGFLSASHSLLLQSAVASSARGRPRKKTHPKKTKMEIKKKEPDVNCQVNSSPSTLLSGLNLGIINHVRNKKQVHSIIKALVNSNAGSPLCINEDHSKRTAQHADEEEQESTDLSLKASNVAAQWLQLLNQDIKGRLSALRQSRTRVCAVITSELPRLFPKEKCSDEFHVFYWENLFSEMENALSEEEKQLECWLCDVKEMQSQLESSENCAEGDKELAVMAAAASIYSSSNFLMSNENGSCFLSSN